VIHRKISKQHFYEETEDSFKVRYFDSSFTALTSSFMIA